MRTNISRGKGSRRPPQPGDIFGLSIPPKGWLFGRVVRTDADAGFGGPRSVLIYVFDAIRASPRPIPMLSKEHLLIPPLMTNLVPWKRGYFVTLETGALGPGDAYERHCFRWGLVYDDEFNNRIKTPFEPVGSGGLAGIKAIDDDISMALSIPCIPDEEADEPPGLGAGVPAGAIKRRACTLTLRIPLGEDEKQDKLELDEVEERLRAAVNSTKAGSWEGHGTNLSSGSFDTRFVGPDAKKLCAALGKAIKKLEPSLPVGWYLTVRYGPEDDEQRVEL